MKELLQKAAKHIFYTVFVLAFVVVTSQLFFDQQTSQLIGAVGGFLNGNNAAKTSRSLDVLRVVYPDEPIALEPTRADPTTRQRLNNIYEPLVQTDRDLKIKPALAVNWGLIDDYTWEFRLRPNVLFHDGSSFDADDVKVSLERALNYPDSELTGILETVKSVSVMDKMTVRIETTTPDPLLLQRLAMILIVPLEYADKEIPKPVGTGSYQFKSWDPESEIVLVRNPNYWGQQSKFKEVDMFVRVDKLERVQMLFDGKVDFIAFVPYDGVDLVKQNGYKITTIPSLEVQFLMFNMQSPLLSDKNNRIAVSMALSQDELIDAIGGFARKVSQFVSSGVFGFSQYIDDHIYDQKQSESIAQATGLKGKTLKFNLSEGLTVLGDYVKEKLKEVGVNVIVSYMDEGSLVESMKNKKADIYFLGFKSGIGDASTFLYFIAYSKGPYNFWGYSNEYVDKLIESSLVEMDVTGRRKNLQESMKVITEDDVVGVPLFEYETVFAFNNKLDINPRIDGIIMFDELTVK